MSYTVALQGYPDLPPELRQQAERRYTRTLERALGSPDDVMPCYQAWAAAQEASEDELAQEDISLALRWQKACMKAMQEGFNGLGECPDAYFEIGRER